MRAVLRDTQTACVLLKCYFSGYYMTGTDTYDIKWSMPHCVLTLRLIALTYDVYDGRKDPVRVHALCNSDEFMILKFIIDCVISGLQLSTNVHEKV